MAAVCPRRSARLWPPVAEPAVTIAMDVQAPVPERLTEATLESVASFVLSREGVNGSWTLGFRFTTDLDIQRMHLEFMGLDSPTDILTFPYPLFDEAVFGEQDQGSAGGDIVISVERASTQAEEVGWALLDELLFLSIHGMLHLLGRDDHDGPARHAMLGRQEALLRDWKAKVEPDVFDGSRDTVGESKR